MSLLKGIKRKVYRTLGTAYLLPVSLVRSIFISAPICDGIGPTVSITSYGRRTKYVYLTIESIARGHDKPGRIILWLDDPRILGDLPKSLKRLAARGLEIRNSDNYGPHTKYYPLVQSGEIDRAFVTADDDILYPRWWLRTLIRLNQNEPETIFCYRARVIKRLSDSSYMISPYKQWPLCENNNLFRGIFLNGISGVIYPKSFAQFLRGTHLEFMKKCPKADDIWLNYVAFRNGVSIRQAFNVALHFPMIPFTQEVGLKNHNVDMDGNDVQLAAVYDSETLRKLFSN